MQSQVRDFFIKPLLALAIAIPAMSTVNVGSAEAGSKRAALIAGIIIGGAIVYHHHKKRNRYHKKRRHYGYAHPRKYYKRGYHKRRGYHRHHRYSGRFIK